MLGVTDLTAYLAITVVTILLPGPNSLFVLSVAARQGVADGYRAAAGVVAGDGLLMLLAVSGVASLMQTHPKLFLVLRSLGACYLAWLGIGLICAGFARWRAQAEHGGAEISSSAHERRPFWRTLGICLTNPKAILFFMAFFVQFVRPDYPKPWLSFVFLGVILQVISLSYLSLLIFAGRHLAEGFKQRPRLSALATKMAGLLFVVFALKLGLGDVWG